MSGEWSDIAQNSLSAPRAESNCRTRFRNGPFTVTPRVPECRSVSAEVVSCVRRTQDTSNTLQEHLHRLSSASGIGRSSKPCDSSTASSAVGAVAAVANSLSSPAIAGHLSGSSGSNADFSREVQPRLETYVLSEPFTFAATNSSGRVRWSWALQTVGEGVSLRVLRATNDSEGDSGRMTNV